MNAARISEDGWRAYELHSIDRPAYLAAAADAADAAAEEGEMKFDGTAFTLYKPDRDVFGADEFHYVIRDKEFRPD